jgi:hypothetical protein
MWLEVLCTKKGQITILFSTITDRLTATDVRFESIQSTRAAASGATRRNVLADGRADETHVATQMRPMSRLITWWT